MTFLQKIADSILNSAIKINGLTISNFLIRRFKKNKKIYYWFAESLLRADKLGEAREIFELGVKNNPGSLDFVEPLSIVSLRIGDYQKAIEYLLISLKALASLDAKELSKIDKTSMSSIYSLLAKANLYIGNIEPVEEYLSRAQELAPWSLDACSTSVEFFLKTEERQRIIPLLNEYINEYPNLYPPYVWLGDYYHFYLQDFESAIIWYATALSKAKDKKAREYCDKFYSVSNLTAACVTNYSNLLLQMGKSENALRIVNEYGNYPYKSDIILNELILDYHIFLKDYEKASMILGNLLRKNPEIHEYWAYLAETQALNLKFEDAENSLNKAFELNPYSFTVLNTAAQIDMIKHDWESAKIKLQKLIKKFPFDLEYQENMKLCLMYLREKQ